MRFEYLDKLHKQLLIKGKTMRFKNLDKLHIPYSMFLALMFEL
jgi:hypothetical protein